MSISGTAGLVVQRARRNVHTRCESALGSSNRAAGQCSSDGESVAFSPAGNAIAVGHVGSPRISAYPWSGAGFGTKYANPATVPTGDGNGVAFSPAGDAIAVAHSSSPGVSAYPWNVSTGFGVKYANPAVLPVTGGNGVAFSPLA